MKKILLLICAVVLGFACAGCAASSQQAAPTAQSKAEQPHFYEIEKVFANGYEKGISILEDDGFKFDAAYTYNSPNTTTVNASGSEVGSGWVGNPPDNPIDETCFIRFADESGNDLDAKDLSQLGKPCRVCMSWHDCAVDDCKSAAAKLQEACGLGNPMGQGWFLGLKDTMWSSFGTATLGGAEGTWEIRIVTGKVGEGSSPMIMVDWSPFRDDYTEKDIQEMLELYQE